jgi:eukaryotic-like serine/threonine-protein kinase
VKLMDLGIARAAAGETLTQTAAMLGTAQYLSPEQAQGQTVDYRSDLYSLGCCLYEMLTGTVPFRGATPVAIAYRHVREDPAPPRLLNPDIPPSLEAVCLKAMAKRPEDRYQTAAELRADLERARTGQRVAAGPAAAGAATAAMATTMLPPLAGFPGAGDPTAAPGGPVTAGRAARHAEPPPGRRRWWLYVLVPLGVLALAFGVAFLVSRLVDPPPETSVAPTLPTATAPQVVPTTLLQTSTSQLPTTSRLPTTTAPPTTAPTTQAQPNQVQMPDVIGRRPRVARAQLEALGLQVNQQQVPVQDSQQANRVIQQVPPAGTTLGRGSTVAIFVGVRDGDDDGGNG